MKHETSDAVNHPAHYNNNPLGECIDYAETMSFSAGNSLKYLWRCGLKNPDMTEDLAKSRWYAERERARIGDDGSTDFKPFELAFAALWERLGDGGVQTSIANWSDVLLLIDFADAL